MTILRGALWERVSTEEQANYGYSIQTQVEALEEYASDNRIKIVDHYCDEGVSAGKPYKQRPEMMRLLKDVEAGKIDIIIFTRLDRWFRNVKEYFKVQEILEKHRVEWRAIWEDYDTTTPNGRMAITIFLAIAQAEREKGSERIREVFQNKRKNRESFFGKNSTPFGYREEPDADGITRLIKDPELEPALDMFWSVAVKYENIDKAVKIVTMAYGLTRSRNKWHELAKKEIYTGTYKGVDNYCPAYVSREEWLRLQNRGSIKKTQHNRIYLFTGLIKCPLCNRNLASRYSKQTLKNGKQKEYYSYTCPDKDIRLCMNRHAISQLKTETWLLSNLRRLLKDEIAHVEIERAKPRPKPKTNINVLKEALRRLEVVYMAGNKTDAEYLREQKELKAAIKKAEGETIARHVDRDIEHLRETLETDFVSIYETLDDEDKRRFWRMLIKEIRIEGNEVVSVVFS